MVYEIGGWLTMVHILLLGQIGLFKVIIRRSHGRLRRQSSDIVNLIGTIRQSLGVICLAFGRLWECVGG